MPSADTSLYMCHITWVVVQRVVFSEAGASNMCKAWCINA